VWPAASRPVAGVFERVVSYKETGASSMNRRQARLFFCLITQERVGPVFIALTKNRMEQFLFLVAGDACFLYPDGHRVYLLKICLFVILISPVF
jgi:hypothetical protein